MLAGNWWLVGGRLGERETHYCVKSESATHDAAVATLSDLYIIYLSLILFIGARRFQDGMVIIVLRSWSRRWLGKNNGYNDVLVNVKMPQSTGP